MNILETSVVATVPDIKENLIWTFHLTYKLLRSTQKIEARLK
jgi:hypothetical protein